MKPGYTVFFCLLSFALAAQGQEDKSSSALHTFYAEAGGAGLLGSLNYEKITPLGASGFRLNTGIGVAHYQNSSTSLSGLLPKIQLQYGARYFHTGIGICVPIGRYAYLGSSGKWSTSPDRWFTEWGAFALPNAHIRFHPPDERYMIGLTGYLLPSWVESSVGKIWPGLSFGASLNIPKKEQRKENVYLHCINLEALGAGITGSLNYEFSWGIPNSKVKFSPGFGIAAEADYKKGHYPKFNYCFLPRTTLTFGAGSIQYGVGVVIPFELPEEKYYMSYGDNFIWPFVQARYQPEHRSFYLALTGYTNTVTEFTINKRPTVFWPGLSLGYTFGHR
jgi:hypothetical protein